MENPLHRWLPSMDKLRASRSLRWLGPLLDRPSLWHLDRRSVALGAAIGVFFGFMIPVAQIFASALFALVLRANLPMAALCTLVSNPFTYGPIFVLAYRTGMVLLGDVPTLDAELMVEQSAEEAFRAPATWGQQLGGIAAPLAIGLAVFAVSGGALAWILVNVLWLAGTRLRRARLERRAAR
jgi:uncharacterized protein